MAQAQVIAKISSISGEAFARDASGKMRRLKVGDAVREGESVVASDGSLVTLKLADGREMAVRPVSLPDWMPKLAPLKSLMPATVRWSIIRRVSRKLPRRLLLAAISTICLKNRLQVLSEGGVMRA